MCASYGASSRTPPPRRPPSAICASTCVTGPAALGERVAALGLGEVELDDGEDVLDPAGHEADVYAACVDELWGLCRTLVTVV